LLWSSSYGSWICNYICNHSLSPLKLWVRIPLRRGVLNTTLCYLACQWLLTGQWFSPGNPVSSTNKTDCHDIAELLLNKVNYKRQSVKDRYRILTTVMKVRTDIIASILESWRSGQTLSLVCSVMKVRTDIITSTKMYTSIESDWMKLLLVIISRPSKLTLFFYRYPCVFDTDNITEIKGKCINLYQ
jgi:hypothetical protein